MIQYEYSYQQHYPTLSLPRNWPAVQGDTTPSPTMHDWWYIFSYLTFWISSGKLLISTLHIYTPWYVQALHCMYACWSRTESMIPNWHGATHTWMHPKNWYCSCLEIHYIINTTISLKHMDRFFKNHDISNIDNQLCSSLLLSSLLKILIPLYWSTEHYATFLPLLIVLWSPY